MWNRKDLLGLKDLSQDQIMEILELAKAMREKIDNKEARKDSLKKFSVLTLFYENSTRTKTSFTMAAEFLGADVNDLGISTSSVKKGESLIDTAKNLDQMGADIMIMRHGMTGAPHLIAKNCRGSVVNAGDGVNEHPTQALLDMFTIHEHKGKFQGLKIVIIGDIKHSRVARSNVFGLTKMGANVVLAGPSTMITSNMKALGADVTSDLNAAVKDADVIIGLRIQLERQKAGMFPDIREYSQLFGINKKLLSLAKDDVIVMHPGPVNRGVEMSTDIIDGDNSLILDQVKNGVAVRMAVIKLLMEGRKNNGITN
ncbi:MAG: aspartate carbamoyltransferase catalytic subunit [Tissierellia bacterium]|nr:aspartate carbamoyltransferase catalytic subunit [Tissierellia bacterium]